jgi:protein subunit release factor B
VSRGRDLDIGVSTEQDNPGQAATDTDHRQRTDRTVVPEYEPPDTDEALLAECDVATFRATGPGGQSVNTTDSAVRLSHRPTGIVVVCRQQRSQLRNKQECLGRLRERIAQHLAPPPPPRKPTQPTAEAVERRLGDKARTSEVKRARQKPGPED